MNDCNDPLTIVHSQENDRRTTTTITTTTSKRRKSEEEKRPATSRTQKQCKKKHIAILTWRERRQINGKTSLYSRAQLSRATEEKQQTQQQHQNNEQDRYQPSNTDWELLEIDELVYSVCIYLYIYIHMYLYTEKERNWIFQKKRVQRKCAI